jgi:pimeloyl-ACP methyl ester carboxylesterase
VSSQDNLAIHVEGSAWILQAHVGGAAATVTGDARTVSAILDGRQSGLKAFLDGRIRVRGNLALALQLETRFANGRRHRRSPVTVRVRAGRLDTFYLESGTGPPVILLHGLGATNASFLTTLWDLAADHRVLAPDLPGHGDSDKPIGKYDAAFYGRWLLDFMEATETRQAHLVGNSLGARIALEAAIVSPERVGRLVLLAAAPVVHRLRQLVPFVRLLRPELAAVPLPVLRSQALSALHSLFAKPERMPEGWFEAAADEFARVFKAPGARVAFFSSLKEIYLEEPFGEAGFWSRLGGMRRPALFVWGQRDPLVPLAHAKAVAKCLPNAGSVVLRDCGHVPQFELPGATNRLIRRFLDQA